MLFKKKAGAKKPEPEKTKAKKSEAPDYENDIDNAVKIVASKKAKYGKKPPESLEKARFKRRFRRNMKRLFVLIIAVTVIFGTAYLFNPHTGKDFAAFKDSIIALTSTGEGYPLIPEDRGITALMPMGRDILAVTPQKLSVYNTRGARTLSFTHNYSAPAYSVTKDRVLIYDLGGSRLSLLTKHRETDYMERKGRILGCDLSESGNFIVAETCDGALGQVTLYMPGQKEAYKRTTSRGYIYDVSISDNGKYFSTSLINYDEGKLYTEMDFHSLEEKFPPTYYKITDEVLLGSEYGSDNRVFAITDKRIHVLSKEGKPIFVTALPTGAYMYSLSADDGIAVAAKTPEGSTVYMYDKMLRPRGQWSVDNKIVSMSFDGDHILILTDGGLYLGDKNLNQVSLRSSEVYSEAVLAGKYMYGLSGGKLIRTGI